MKEKNVENLNDITKEAIGLLIMGVEPLPNENLRDFVKRGEKIIREKYVRTEGEEVNVNS